MTFLEQRRQQRRRRTLIRFGNALIVMSLAVIMFLWAISTAATPITYVATPPEYPKVLGEVTAYTSSPDETDDTPFITASGETTRRGIVACPGKYPFGTLVLIEGLAYTCEDRMNKRYRETEHWDVWVPTKAEAYKWGRRELLITIIR